MPLRVLAALSVAILSIGLAACTPSSPPGAAGPNCYGHSYGGQDIGQQIDDGGRTVGASPADRAKAQRTAVAESGCDPNAYNPSTAAGIFQIKVPMHDDEYLRLAWAGCWYGGPAWSVPRCNIAVMWAMWVEQGWVPWNGGD